MKCCSVEETVGGECLSKLKLYPKDTKVCSDEAFLPSYQALSDNTYTNTLLSVLRISYPE